MRKNVIAIVATGCDIYSDVCDISSIGWPETVLCVVLVVAAAAVAIAFFRS
jgi:hypothetical protein